VSTDGPCHPIVNATSRADLPTAQRRPPGPYSGSCVCKGRG
jgi:hypothetical protein